MRTNRLLGLTVLVLILLATVIPVRGQGPDPLEQIHDASAAWDAAYNARDIEGLLELYADHVISMPPGAPIREGKDALRADFKYVFANYTGQHKITILDLRMSDELAVEVGRYTVTPLSFQPASEQTSEYQETGTHIVIRELIDDEWKIVWEIWNTDG